LKNSQTIISTTPEPSEAEFEQGEAEFERRESMMGPEQHKRRLDQVLVELVPEFSRSYLQQLIDIGAVSLNGELVAKAAHRVKLGDRAAVELRPTPQSRAFKAESMGLNLVYQDEHLLVIDKPAGLVVHPAPGNWSGTLMNGLLAFDQHAFELPRAGIVHRLDKDTSGLMVVARSRQVMDALVKAIADRVVKRHYLALAQGTWKSIPACQVSAPIGRDPANRLRMAVVDLLRSPGKGAHTDFLCLDSCAKGSLVHCSLQTGRTHQIRVHLSFLGYPLVGDALYGGAPNAGMVRQALHAVKLAFQHPVTGKPMLFVARPPSDFEQALGVWGLKYNLAEI
jgi:23S rRNA pseudouridine1911/1915/1917 synthase